MHFHPAANGSPSPLPQGFPPNGNALPHSSHSPSSNPDTSAYRVGDYNGSVNPSRVYEDEVPASDSTSAPQFRPDNDHSNDYPSDWIEQLQLALAIANPELLQQLVLHSQMPMVAQHQLGGIQATVSVPIESTRAADAVLTVEMIACQLSPDTSTGLQTADASASRNSRRKTQSRYRRSSSRSEHRHHDSPDATPENPSKAIAQHRALVSQISRETKLQTLGMNIPLPEAIALLQYATFSLPDIQRILNLPDNGWHRSWWNMIDPTIDPTAIDPRTDHSTDASSTTSSFGFPIPFKRLIRSRRYADGTVMLQYKDQFAHIPPPCFRTQQRSVLVHIQRPNQSLAETLAWINHAQKAIEADEALLLYHHLSPLEQQALLNQGIHLYHCPMQVPDQPQHQRPGSPQSAPLILEQTPGLPQPLHQTEQHTIELTEQPSLADQRMESAKMPTADCRHCHQADCPMHGHPNSPVVVCRQYHPEAPAAPVAEDETQA